MKVLGLVGNAYIVNVILGAYGYAYEHELVSLSKNGDPPRELREGAAQRQETKPGHWQNGEAATDKEESMSTDYLAETPA